MTEQEILGPEDIRYLYPQETSKLAISRWHCSFFYVNFPIVIYIISVLCFKLWIRSFYLQLYPITIFIPYVHF